MCRTKNWNQLTFLICQKKNFWFWTFQRFNCYVQGLSMAIQEFSSDKFFEWTSKTYTIKGLIRNCTKHSGNHEMIWKRTSKQSILKMLIKSSKVDQHQYYYDLMNIFLLHYIKKILNILMEEAIVKHCSYLSKTKK